MIIPELYGNAGYDILVVAISSPGTRNYRDPSRKILEVESSRLVSEHKVHRAPLHVQILENLRKVGTSVFAGDFEKCNPFLLSAV